MKLHPDPIRSAALVMFSASLLLGMPLYAAAADWSATMGVDFSSGKYGGGQATEIWYVPLSLKWEEERSTLKFTLPWLRIRSPSGGNVIDVDANGQPIYDGTGPMESEEGMGDMVLSYTWSAWTQPHRGFLLDLGGKIKLATADETKGLGSGKNDYSVQADVYYLAGALSPFATLGYRMPGDPAGVTLDNQWFGTLGLGYKLSGTDSTGFMWDFRQASRPGSEHSNEATLYWVHKFSGDFKLQTYTMKGFSQVSPDWGLGLMASVIY
jgi:hypothetical protein